MTNEAANALLKTLEEPPLGVIFLLTTSHLRKLPQTIISRCESIAVPLASRNALREYALSHGAPEQAREEMITIAQGRGEHLLKLLKDPHFLSRNRSNFKILLTCSPNGKVEDDSSGHPIFLLQNMRKKQSYF